MIDFIMVFLKIKIIAILFFIFKIVSKFNSNDYINVVIIINTKLSILI